MRDFFGIACIVLSLLSGCRRNGASERTEFPTKPITIVVYTGPGGAIDMTARRFRTIAEKYTDATIVVENKPGAGGIVAIKRVLQMPADGHTVLACTKSNISKIVSSGRVSYIDTLDWIAMLMADPECIITLTHSDLCTWQAVVQDARAKDGKQIWVGPALGGLDHVMAMKTWERSGIWAKWIPYESGLKAKAELLGNRGVAYVGNPGDAAGNPDLTVAVVSSPSRILLPGLAEVPTFHELGVEGLDREIMWRGLAVKKETPPEALAWLDDLIQKVTADPEWRAYWEKSGIEVVHYGADRFTAIVRQDRDEFAHYLTKIGIEGPGEDSFLTRMFQGAGLAWLVLGLVLANGLLALVVARWRGRDRIGNFLIPSFFFSVSLLFLGISLVFPRTEDVGPAAVPRLWIALLLPLSVYLLQVATKDQSPTTRRGERTDLVWKLAVGLAIYMVAIEYLGYFFCTFVFLVVTMYWLGLRRIGVMVSVSLGWLAISYLTFVRLLYVPLPAGRLVERFLSL